MPDRLATTRMILYAAARVLGCGSVQLLMADEERRVLVFLTSITNRELPRLQRVESELGFQLDGAAMPIDAVSSTMVQAYVEERPIIVYDIAQLAGGIIPEEALAAIRAAIGPRTFASVPVFTRAGKLGVLLFEKPDESGFSSEDRELLIAYAERVGADLESQVLSDEVERLETLDAGGQAPALFLLKPDLTIEAGPRGVGETLYHLLDVTEVSLRAALSVEGTPSLLSHLRLTATIGAAGLAVAVEDLTAWDRLRREAARAREHLAKVLHSVEDVILTLDPDAVILSGNLAVRRALGVEAEALVGRPFEELCHDERSLKRVGELRPLVRSTGFGEAELRLKHRDGRAVSTKVSALLLADDEERPTGVLVRIHDLTERRRSEAERNRLRDRLMHTERLSALGEMAARIAHEVRNPLVSIGAAAQVIAEELPEGSPVAAEVQAIVRETRRLDAIVTDFLGFARPPKHERRLVDLTAVLRESVDLARPKADGYTLAIHAAVAVLARVDPDAIKQVLLNVILNAVEASPTGIPGTIDCEARILDEEWVELSVADRGPGIPASSRTKVFNPFYSTKTRGTGLGLAVSKQIVDEHHGRLRLLSRRGGGTRVVIQLPIGYKAAP